VKSIAGEAGDRSGLAIDVGSHPNQATKMKPLSALRNLVLSPTNRIALLYAFTGLGFSGANLILAKALPAAEYGTLALVVSVFALAAPLAPLGADGVILRRLLNPHPWILARVVGTSLAVSTITVVAVLLVYDIPSGLLPLLGLGLATGGVTMAAAASYQRLQRFIPALLLQQSANLFLITASLLMLINVVRALWFPVAAIALGYTLVAVLSWNRLLRDHSRAEFPRTDSYWTEALHFAGVSGGSLLLLQSERLLIPQVLSLEHLASFGVLAAVVIAPYRTLQMGANFSVLPRMRSADSVHERRRLLGKEAASLAVLVSLGSIALYWLAPLVFELIFADKYQFSRGLIVAGILAGIVRAVSGLSTGVATAVCNTRELGQLNTLTWLCTAVAAAGGIVGARWGLTGVVYGIAFGWLILSTAYAIKAFPHLRRPG
jgi:hypothetical protein